MLKSSRESEIARLNSPVTGSHVGVLGFIYSDPVKLVAMDTARCYKQPGSLFNVSAHTVFNLMPIEEFFSAKAKLEQNENMSKSHIFMLMFPFGPRAAGSCSVGLGGEGPRVCRQR